MTGALFVYPDAPNRALRLEETVNKEKAMQKEQFLRETERQLRMAQVEAKLTLRTEQFYIEARQMIIRSLNQVDAEGTVMCPIVSFIN